ncbi:uncharacterized protein LOC124136590 isoform X1 [Haliotis rufescens]|uniref:uncharacterized protein LOC124136590 isoform X1 n=2 Tax=Haliotis rufescens TaxID=6454 RepID=UPI00201FA15E|nr:uncharacterized protein LOC124136590 isoform X1 [Haliotis rufescens]
MEGCGPVTQDAGDDVVDAGFIVDMTARVQEGNCRAFELPSNDPFLPKLHQIGNSLDDIASHLTPKGGVSFYPRNMGKNPSTLVKSLCSRIEEKYTSDEQSLVYLANSLSVTINIPIQKVPQQVVCDVCIVSQSAPVVVMTLVGKNSEAPELVDYNLQITKGFVSQVRNFTDEHFSALYGVLQESDLASEASFQTAIERIRSHSSSFCIPDSLSMNEEKFRDIVKALAASVAVSKALQVIKSPAPEAVDEADFEDEEEGGLWLLTKDQFVLLTENIDTSGMVVVWASTHTGSSTLLMEVASRLQQSGNTLLVSGSKAVCESARHNQVCYRVVSSADFLQLQANIGGMLAEFEHIVAEDIPEVMLHGARNSHVWLCMKVKENTTPKGNAASPKSPVFVSMNGRPPLSPTTATAVAGKDPVYRTTISFSLPVDTHEPWVYDFTVVTDNNKKVIVAIDRPNCRIKCFYTEDGEIRTSYLSVDKDTTGITNIDNRVALTVPKSRLIRVISVIPDLHPHSIIPTQRRYYDIATLGFQKMAVSAPLDGRPCVDIIDYSGNILKSIATYDEGQTLFNHPLTVQTIFPNKVLVYDKHNGSIVCVSERGQLLFRYIHERKLENPCGMTVTPAGDILVADSRQHRVIHINQEGKFMRNILTRPNGMVFPYRVCCDGTGVLYVATHYKEVKLYEFK